MILKRWWKTLSWSEREWSVKYDEKSFVPKKFTLALFNGLETF